jgi:hypothetical protein
VTVCGAGHESTVAQDVWVTVTVSIVLLNDNAVAAVHVEAKAKADPKRDRISIFAVTKVGVNGRNSPAMWALAGSYTLHSARITVSWLVRIIILIMSRLFSPSRNVVIQGV